MRCPKCGYITFDHLEICTKCRKKIAATSQQLSGTVFKAEAPAFLQLNAHKLDTDTNESIDLSQENNDIDVQFSFDGNEDESDKFQAGEEIEFDFAEESQDALASHSNEEEGEDEFDLDLFDDESVELDLDVSEVDVAEENEGPRLNFNELDISDLAPPSAEKIIEDPENVKVVSENDSAQPSMGTGGVLEDLQMDEFDLKIAPLSSSDNSAGKNLKPSVKTGTALDGFDIDLGELMSGHDK